MKQKKKGIRIYKWKIIGLKGQHPYIGILFMIEPSLHICRGIRHYTKCSSGTSCYKRFLKLKFPYIIKELNTLVQHSKCQLFDK